MIGTAGVGGLGIAAWLGAMTLAKVHAAGPSCDADYTRCHPPGMTLIGQARDLQTAGLVLAGVSATAAVAGVVLILKTKPARLTAAVEGSGLMVRGRW